LDDPLIAGPSGPSLEGSLLWQATQLATKTALPLFLSPFLPEFGESFEHAPRASPQTTAKRHFFAAPLMARASRALFAATNIMVRDHPVKQADELDC
jgi:hypothetical protein